MKISTTPIIFLLLLGVTAFDAQAQTVKKWVDEQGVTHYSDQEPPGGDAEVKEVEIPRGSVSEFEAEEVNKRLNSVLEQMEKDREAREEEAAEQKKAREAEKALEREPVVEEKKKKRKKDRDRPYFGPYPKPPPGPFPEQYPRPRGPFVPTAPVDSSESSSPDAGTN